MKKVVMVMISLIVLTGCSENKETDKEKMTVESVSNKTVKISADSQEKSEIDYDLDDLKNDLNFVYEADAPKTKEIEADYALIREVEELDEEPVLYEYETKVEGVGTSNLNNGNDELNLTSSGLKTKVNGQATTSEETDYSAKSLPPYTIEYDLRTSEVSYDDETFYTDDLTVFFELMPKLALSHYLLDEDFDTYQKNDFICEVSAKENKLYRTVSWSAKKEDADQEFFESQPLSMAEKYTASYDRKIMMTFEKKTGTLIELITDYYSIVSEKEYDTTVTSKENYSYRVVGTK